ncbi:MAG TPA: sulfite oxidase [Candidatus Dormibacteraeota bacterium]|nr:sulfite oxidase [Candidatus Dormibacteraeota bacterium]
MLDPRTSRGVVKQTPPDLMIDTGTGLDFETRLDQMPGHLTPLDRFFVRNHAPTPRLDASRWQLSIDGGGVRKQVTYRYADLWTFPLVSMVRTLECAGNRRKLFGEACGRQFEGTPWLRGAISTAEWTGVRLRDLLEPAGVSPYAREVMPEGLDAVRGRRPMPLSKAMAEDTLLALVMNGEVLSPDHGYPARVVVSGWLGAASIKWVGRIQVSEQPLYVPWNTDDYVLIGPNHPPHGPALGVPIAEMPVTSVVELPWPAQLVPGPQLIRGRAYAGEGRIERVEYQVDGGDWQEATLLPPNMPAIWVRWQVLWDARPGEHVLRVRACDDRGRRQPDSVPRNELGYLYNAVLAHPVHVGRVDGSRRGARAYAGTRAPLRAAC